MLIFEINHNTLHAQAHPDHWQRCQMVLQWALMNLAIDKSSISQNNASQLQKDLSITVKMCRILYHSHNMQKSKLQYCRQFCINFKWKALFKIRETLLQKNLTILPFFSRSSSSGFRSVRPHWTPCSRLLFLHYDHSCHSWWATGTCHVFNDNDVENICVLYIKTLHSKKLISPTGIILVTTIKPGVSQTADNIDRAGSTPNVTTADTLMDLIRLLVPHYLSTCHI